jgi:4-amino-4-deoxy-L-arabinose transferase-like glycosyltransferase
VISVGARLVAFVSSTDRIDHAVTPRPTAAARGSKLRAPLLLLVACLSLRVVALCRPCLSDDEATYCVIGRELLTGHVLYQDVVDHKPPLIYLTYAATQALGGRVGGMLLLHVVSILVVFATALLLGRIARRLAIDRGAAETADRESLVAAALYVVFSTTLFDFDALAANCELFMMLPLTASVVLYLSDVRSELRGARLFATGVLVGVAMFYKYQAGVQLPLYALHLALVHRRRPVRVFLGVLALAGGVAVVVAVCAGILHRAGDLKDAWFWFRFNFAYIQEGLKISEVLGRAAVRLSYVIVPALLIWLLGGAAVARALVRRDNPDDRSGLDRLVAGWLIVSLFATSIGGRFFGHYFYQVIAPLSVLAAPKVLRLWIPRRRLILGATVVPAGIFLLLGVFHRPVMAAAGQADPDYTAITSFLDANSRPEDGLVIWGNTPVLYFEAGRPLGCRFAFSNYLTGLSPATRTQSDPTADSSANIVPESWAMFEDDLVARRPRLFVDTSPGNLGFYGKYPPAKYPRLRAILDRDYVLIGRVGGAEVLALRDR